MGKKSVIDQIKNFFTQAKSELSILRDKITETKASLEYLENKPIDFPTAQAKLKEAIAWHAWRFAEGRFNQIPLLNQNNHANTLGVNFAGADAFQMQCFFNPEAVQAKLEGALQEFLELNPGVAPGERVKQLAELRDQLAKLESEEEAIIRDAAEVGMRVPRRPDANPEVILNL